MGKYQQPIKSPAHYFQSRALEFISHFKVQEKKSVIFMWFKRRPDKAEAAFRNMMGKKLDDPATYFIALMYL